MLTPSGLRLLPHEAVPISSRILLANGIARVTSSILNYFTIATGSLRTKTQRPSKLEVATWPSSRPLYSHRYALDSTSYTAFGPNLLISKIVVGSFWSPARSVKSDLRRSDCPTSEILFKNPTPMLPALVFDQQF